MVLLPERVKPEYHKEYLDENQRGHEFTKANSCFFDSTVHSFSNSFCRYHLITIKSLRFDDWFGIQKSSRFGNRTSDFPDLRETHTGKFRPTPLIPVYIFKTPTALED